MKGVLNPDHIPVNNYAFIVPGMPNFTPTNITGLEEELEKVSLPDRTAASGGHTKDGEFTVTLPLHHTREQQAMERWYVDSQEPVAPDYKKPATLVLPSISGLTIVTFLTEGIGWWTTLYPNIFDTPVFYIMGVICVGYAIKNLYIVFKQLPPKKESYNGKKPIW